MDDVVFCIIALILSDTLGYLPDEYVIPGIIRLGTAEQVAAAAKANLEAMTEEDDEFNSFRIKDDNTADGAQNKQPKSFEEIL